MPTSLLLVPSALALLASSASAQFQAALPAPSKAAPGAAIPTVLQPGTSNLALGSDSCSAPERIDGLGFFGFDNTNATTGAEGQGEAACLFFGTTGIARDVWFDWTAPATGSAQLRTCALTSIDSKIAVYAGGGCPAADALACTDDNCSLQSELAFAVTAGAHYAIQLGVFPNAAGGAGAFELRIAPPPASCTSDDGASENSLGATSGGTLVWVDRFETIGAGTVASVSVAFGTPGFPDSSLNGLPVLFAVWDDPDDDGLPDDLELVGTVGTAVANSSTDQFVTATFPAPLAVSGVYFVGALMAHAAGRFPAGFDTNAPLPNRAFVGVGPAGGVDPANLGGTLSTQLTPIEALGFPGTFLVRADCAVTTASSICGSPSIPCPCANPGGPGRGCANTSNIAGGLLASRGVPTILAGDVVLTASGMPPYVSFCQFAQSATSNAGVSFGDGVLCLGPGQVRIGVRPVVHGSAAIGYGVTGPVNVLGGVTLPGTRAYQVVYRNSAPYCTSATFNATNGVVVTWF